MVKQDLIRKMYMRFKYECSNDTQSCLGFLTWLHEENNELRYIKGMSGLTLLEIAYIDSLLN